MCRLLVVLIAVALVGCAKKSGGPLDPDLARFVAAKRKQAQEIADLQTNEVPAKVWRFFDAVQRNHWRDATNLFAQLRTTSRRYDDADQGQSPLATAWRRLRRNLGDSAESAAALQTEVWSPIMETLGTYEMFHEWDVKWLRRFGRDIISSIPSGSIYFGGDDPGRFAISAFSASHRDGRPFFTVTQNALADGTYLAYLRTMYGQLQLPGNDDSQRAFQEYLSDAQERLRKNELKPGEDVKIVENRVQVSGQVAVMQINGLIAKVIFEKNPTREMYVEESFPLDWMYPYLEPHGLIMKLNREPLADLNEEVVARDREFWNKYVAELVGGWLDEETSAKEISEFGEKVFLREDLAGFGGDSGFAHNEAAQKAFSKLRSAIGGIYAWRAEHAKTSDEKQRLTREADIAFRQAFALCPYSPEAVFRYVNLLLQQHRIEDAGLVARTFSHLDPKNPDAHDLVERIQKMK